MVAWFIIAIATLAVFAFIAVNGVQTVASTTDGVGRVETARRMEAAVNALLSRSASPNNSGTPYLLAGVTVNGAYTLPAELASYAATPFGQTMVYCPFGGETGGTATNVPSVNGTSYPIQTTTLNGKTYVTGGRPTFPQVAENPNLMGWILAPRTKTSALPSCNSVIFNPTTKRFEAPDAFVRPIIRAAGSLEMRESMSREVVFYVSQTGTGRGLAQNDPTSFATALDFYRTRQPGSMKIIMADGSYILPKGYLNIDGGGWQDRGTGANLTISAPGGSAQIDQNGADYIQIPGNLTLSGVYFDADSWVVANRARRVSMTNGSAGRLHAYNGGFVYAENVTIMADSNWAVLALQGGQVAMAGVNVVGTTNGQNTIGAVNGGSVNVEGGSITYRLSSGSGRINYANYVEEGAQMTLRSVAINYAAALNTGVAAAGRFTSSGTNYAFAAGGTSSGFELHRGSDVAISDGAMTGSKPTYGVLDYSAGRVDGTGFVVRATTSCWTAGSAAGQIFSMSGQGNANVTSSVTADETLPALTDPMTAAQVSAYSQATKNNAKRQMLRAINTSTWSCAA